MFASLVITASAVGLIYANGFEIFTPLFWFKIITLGLMLFFVSFYKKNEFYYYHNLGVSKRLLWTSISIIDLLIFMVLILSTLQIR